MKTDKKKAMPAIGRLVSDHVYSSQGAQLHETPNVAFCGWIADSLK